MALAGFSSLDICGAAPTPGAGTIEYVPVPDVDEAGFEWALKTDTWNLQKEFSATWLTLPHAGGSAQWTEDQQRDAQGDYYNVSLTALLPADTAAVRGELNSMKQYRYLLRITRGSMVLLVGTLDMPLRFDSRFDSGADGGDTRGHRCTFSGVALQKSPGYVPAF